MSFLCARVTNKVHSLPKTEKQRTSKRFRYDLCEIDCLRAPSVCEKKISRQNETVMATGPINCLPLRDLYNAFYYGPGTKESSFDIVSTHTRMVRATTSRRFGKVFEKCLAGVHTILGLTC